MKSLRGHKADIISTVCLSGLTTDIEHPSPPSVISLSSDSVVYGWKINEVAPAITWLTDPLCSCRASHRGGLKTDKSPVSRAIVLATLLLLAISMVAPISTVHLIGQLSTVWHRLFKDQ